MQQNNNNQTEAITPELLVREVKYNVDNVGALNILTTFFPYECDC